MPFGRIGIELFEQRLELTSRSLRDLALMDQATPTRILAWERTAAVAQNVAERVEQFRGRFERWREGKTEGKPEQQLETQKGSSTEAKQQEMQRAGPELVVNDPIAQGREAFQERYEAYKQATARAVIPELKQEQVQEKGPEKALEKDLEIDRGHGFDIGP